MWKQRNDLEEEKDDKVRNSKSPPGCEAREWERESKEAFVIHLGVLLILEEFSQPVVVITSVLR